MPGGASELRLRSSFPFDRDEESDEVAPRERLGETSASSTREGRSRIDGTGSSVLGGYASSARGQVKYVSSASKTKATEPGRERTFGRRLVATPGQPNERRKEAEERREDDVADLLCDDAPYENGRDACTSTVTTISGDGAGK